MKPIKVTSGLCIATSALTLITGILAMFNTNRSHYAMFALFSMLRHGTIIGFIGNLLGIVLMGGGFLAMGYYALKMQRIPNYSRQAFIYSCLVSILAVISLICSIAAHTFNFGDIIFTLLPIAHLFLIFREK